MSTAHPSTGRSDTGAVVSGPRAGTYAVINVPVGGELITQVSPGAATFIKYVRCDFACRIMGVSFMADVTATVGTHTWAVQNGGAAGSGTTAITGSLAVPASDTVTSVLGAALANRDIAQGNILRFLLVGTDPGDITTRGMINVTVWIRGHAVLDPNND